jgi:cytochrome b561
VQGKTSAAIRILHWCIVLGVVVAYATAYYRQSFTTQSESANWYFLVVHMNVGFLIFALSLLALVRRRIAKLDREQSTPVLGQFLARTMHYFLYFMLFALPVAASIGTGFDFPLFGLTNLPGFMRFDAVQSFVQQDLNMLTITFMEPFAEFHRHIGSAVIFPVLLAGHTAAALFNRFAARGSK